MTPTVILLPRTGRSPFQLYLLALIIISGFATTLGFADNAITDQMGEPYTTLWGFFLTGGGVLSLTGIYWPKNPISGMLIERTGVVALGGASLIWSVLVIWRVHWNGFFTASLTFGLFLACIAQWYWINKNVNKVMKAIDDK